MKHSLFQQPESNLHIELDTQQILVTAPEEDVASPAKETEAETTVEAVPTRHIEAEINASVRSHVH